jgi:membrane protein implicated in regulation of membrane protease activity
MRLEDLIRTASTRVEAVRVIGSAINPLLWLTGLVTPISLVLSVWAGEPWQRFMMMLIAVIPVAITVAAYVRFMIRDPDRLQSEEFRLRQRALKMLYKRGANAEIVEVAKENARIEKLPGTRDEGDKP